MNAHQLVGRAVLARLLHRYNVRFSLTRKPDELRRMSRRVVTKAGVYWHRKRITETMKGAHHGQG